jgi:PAS domain S-box-containing protein
VKSESPSSFPATSEGPPSEPSARTAPADSEPRPPLATLDLALLRGALEELPFGVATTREGVILYANEALARIYGARGGELEGKHVSQLFPDDVYSRIAQRLDEVRVFDGRVHTLGIDGRSLDAEVHVEWYSSEAQGVGGFLVVRDVSLELGALGRLVDQLGAALFRIRVADGAIELVSPGISKLTGIDAATCTQHPVLLTALVSAEERERVLFLYRRMIRGEIAVGSAQVSLKRPDGTTRVLQLRATGRRDTIGQVRHIEGVVSDAAREAAGLVGGSVGGSFGAHATVYDGGFAPRPAGLQHDVVPSRDPLASASMVLSHELLREGSQHLHGLQREIRGLRGALKAHADRLPRDVADDLSLRLESLSSIHAGAAALNRSVRRALSGSTTLGAPLAEVFETVRATLAPIVSPLPDVSALVLDVGDAANAVIPERIQELGAALVYLALRAYRFAGSGTLRIAAHRVTGVEPPRQRLRHSRPPPEREQVQIEILGAAPADMTDSAIEISSELVNTVPRPAEADVAYQAAHTLIGCAGGCIDSDDTTFSTARTVVRLRL